MKILLIGGTGQISTAVTQRLLTSGHQVAHLNRGQTTTHGRAPIGVRTLVGDRKDFTAARSDLGFAPQISFDECIRRIHAHLAANKLIERAETDEIYERLLARWQRSTDELVATFNH